MTQTRADVPQDQTKGMYVWGDACVGVCVGVCTHLSSTLQPFLNSVTSPQSPDTKGSNNV